MEVIRNMTIDTELFRLGDIISFALSTGEKVKAKAIRETPNEMRPRWSRRVINNARAF